MKTKAKTIGLWILTGLLSVGFLFFGGPKLLARPPFPQHFAELGFPPWFLFVTGACEVGGAILLAIPRTSAFGAIILACTMVGAVLTHVTHNDLANSAPAAVLLVLVLVVLYARRDTLLRLVGRGHRVQTA
jgi:putative oxidoreductase